MRIIIFLAVLFICNSAFAQAGTDIWLFQISKEDGKLVLKNGKNITSRKGYDNQPHFSKDNKSIYFSSGRDSAGQTDIYRYDIGIKKTKQITFTSTSEFSPAITPNGNLSVVMVEKDSSQHIWEFPLKGNQKPKRLFSSRDSIGYYTSLRGDAVICYILGSKTNPSRLAIVTSNGWENTIDTGVGRGFAMAPGLIFTKPAMDSGYFLYKGDWIGQPQRTHVLIRTPGKSQDFTVFQDHILMGHDSEIHSAKFRLEKMYVSTIEEFKPAIDLSAFGLKKITRLAISPDKKWIAIVAADN